MRLFSLLFLLIFLQQPAPSARKTNEPKQQQSSTGQQSSAADQRGTEKYPLMVKVIPAPKTQREAEQEIQDRNRKASSDWWTVRLTGTLALIAFLQFLVYAYQAEKLRQTVKSAEGQSKAMERHIDEAARSATAMETIATTIREGNKAVTRAYLTVVIGGAIPQQKGGEGEGDLKFQALPLLRNTGVTPAREVNIRINADILPIPIPETFTFPPKEGGGLVPVIATQVLGAHQDATLLGGIVDKLVPDADVPSVKQGDKKCLCVWGAITYQDIFKDQHTTRFGQQLFWLPDGKIHGFFIPGQNDSD